ncbi:MAG: hypothetical protein ABR561_06745, partial [Guyparkeria sp.]
MPSAPAEHITCPWHRGSWWRMLLLSLLLVLTGPALAQQAGGSGAGASSQAAESPESGAEGRYAGLLELLKDPAKRDELIAELERLSSGQAKSAQGESSGSDAEPAADTAGIADGIASGFAGVVSGTVADMTGAATRLVKRGVDADWVAVGQVAWRAAVALAIAYLVLVIGRRLLAGVWRRLDTCAQAATTRSRLFRTGVSVLAALALGVVLLLVAYVAAQASVWWLADGDELTSTVLGLALQAFILVEVARLLIVTAFAPALDGLRLFRLSK